MSRPLVSVVIPTFNRARYVVEAVESVLAQTFTDYEIIVVDDGSTDGTREALAPYEARIRYVYQKNKGLAAARNVGIAEAKGEFIAFLDSDDAYEPGFLAAALSVFQRYPQVGAVFSAEREMDELGNRLRRVHTKRSPGTLFTTAGMLRYDTGVGCGRPPVVRKAWLDRGGGFDESFRSAVDCEMWIRYSFHMPMALQPEPLVLRRVHSGHLSGDRGKNAEHWLRILDRLAAEHPDFVKAHPWIYRRAVGKENLRLGRGLLTRCAEDASLVPRARTHLWRSVRMYPFFMRAYFYLAASLLWPRGYASRRSGKVVKA